MVRIEACPGGRWTALRTRPRCEKLVATFCERQDILHYLPLRRRAARYQRRLVQTLLPLFPGYLFVRLPAGGRSVLSDSAKTVAILRVDEAQERQLIEELCSLQQLEQAAALTELRVHPKLEPGRTVRIAAGPLRGLTGIVHRGSGTTRVVVNVDLLGQAVSADLDLEWVEPD